MPPHRIPIREIMSGDSGGGERGSERERAVMLLRATPPHTFTHTLHATSDPQPLRVWICLQRARSVKMPSFSWLLALYLAALTGKKSSSLSSLIRICSLCEDFYWATVAINISLCLQYRNCQVANSSHVGAAVIGTVTVCMYIHCMI